MKKIDKLIVEVINPEHPHYQKRGYVEVKNNRVAVSTICGKDMFTVNIDDGEKFMAAYSDCRLIRRFTGYLKSF